MLCFVSNRDTNKAVSLDKLADNLVELKAVASEIDHSVKVLKTAADELSQEEVLQRLDSLLTAVESVEGSIGRLSAEKVQEAAKTLDRASRLVSKSWFGVTAAAGALTGFFVVVALGAFLVHSMRAHLARYESDVLARYGKTVSLCQQMGKTGNLRWVVNDTGKYVVVRALESPIQDGPNWYFRINE